MGVLISSEQRFRKLIYFWVAVHAYLAIFSIFESGFGPGGFLMDENDLALALNCALPFAYFLRQSDSVSGRAKFFLTIAMVLILAAIVATMSRGGFVGLAVTAAAIIWFSKNRLRNAVFVCIIGASFAALIPSDYRAEILSISDTEDSTRNERLDSWTLGWRMFVDNPVLGVGYGNYPWTVTPYQMADPELRNIRWLGGRVAHSLYFTLLPETGLIGTILYGSILIVLLRSLRGSIRIARAAVPGGSAQFIEAAARASIVSLIGFLATATFISVLYYPQFWYAVGFAYVIRHLATRLEPAADDNPRH
jgi:O-antigen ligase